MCTVTYIPLKDTCFITSNRDENSKRITAMPPEIYDGINNRKVYPKDSQAGGTWIACKDNGTAAVLLNGAFKKHIPSPPYKRSRGLVFLEILDAENPVGHFMDISMEAIEPFTMIILDESLHECRWDGTIKHCSVLNKSNSYIWSSLHYMMKQRLLEGDNGLMHLGMKPLHPGLTIFYIFTSSLVMVIFQMT